MSAWIEAGSATGAAVVLGDGLGVADVASPAGVEGVGLSGAAVEVAADEPPVEADDATPDPDGTVVVGAWLPVEHAPARAATSPVAATTRHTRAVVDR
jgi:hypothetical protein